MHSVITNGAMEALTATFLTLFEPGDEVIVPAPYFSAYADEIAIANAVLVPVISERYFGGTIASTVWPMSGS